jgi:hypothetical protein
MDNDLATWSLLLYVADAFVIIFGLKAKVLEELLQTPESIRSMVEG